MPHSVSGYIVTLGQSPKLSLEELTLVCARNRLALPHKSLNPHQVLLKQNRLDNHSLMRQLGGTVKIARVVDVVSLEQASHAISRHMRANQSKFAVSSFNVPHSQLKRLAQQVKNELRDRDTTSGFRILKTPLESAGITDAFSEFQIVKDQDSVLIAQVESVQDIDRWSTKDYARPVANPHTGMLPPKIARIMVNLALPRPFTPETLILDPFCGTGTILLEGLDSGVSVSGSDISSRQVDAAVKNCRWFTQTFSPPGSYRVHTQDAVHLSPTEFSPNLEAIVFEGYLGPPSLKDRNVANIWKGLEKLYLGTFKHLSRLLPVGKRLVCALPQYHGRGPVKTMDPLVDRCEKYGYTSLTAPITYGRISATIKRSIYVLQRIER